MPTLTAAITYAAAGYRVFPCGPDKRPRVRWKEAATTDEMTIREWWRQRPDAMIGLPTGDGLAVVDLDVDETTGEAIGEATAVRLGLADALRHGLQATTPSGGRHVYFAGDLSNSAGQLGPGLDTRGAGGYVIAPGSVNERGTYRWMGPGLPETKPPPLPAAIAAAVRAGRAAHSERSRFDAVVRQLGWNEAGPDEVREILCFVDPDSGGYDQWCEILMGLHEHFGGSHTGLHIAEDWSSRGAKYKPGEVPAKWRSFAPGAGITFATVCQLARDNGADLANIARRHRCRQRQPDRPDGEHGNTGPDQLAPSPPMRFLNYAEMRAMPAPDWIVPGVLQARTAALLFGKSNTFKSFLAVDLALSAATGRDWHGAATQKGKILYIATEGANGLGRIRIPGWYHARGVPDYDRFDAFLWPREVTLDSESSVDALIASLRSELYGGGFTLVVADIFGGTMIGPETKDETARAWVAGVQGLIREASVTVLSVAHTGWADETRARMHTHFWGSFDTRLKAEGDKDTMQTILSVDRHKDADSTGSWGFQMVPVTGPDGLETLVPELSDDVDTKPRTRVSGKPLIALQALDDALAQYGKHMVMDGLPSCRVVAMTDWRSMCDRHCLSDSDKEDARRQAFTRARSRLQDLDLVRCYENFAWRTGK